MLMEKLMREFIQMICCMRDIWKVFVYYFATRQLILIRTNADDPSSKAYGSLIDGIFDGHIVLGNGTSFTIEKASRYYSKDTRPNHFHSIIYADEMINHEKFRKKREANDENKIDGDDTGDAMMQFFCADETIFR